MLKLRGTIKKTTTGQKLDQQAGVILTLQVALEAELDGDGPAVLRDLVEMQQNGEVVLTFAPVQGKLPGAAAK